MLMQMLAMQLMVAKQTKLESDEEEEDNLPVLFALPPSAALPALAPALLSVLLLKI